MRFPDPLIRATPKAYAPFAWPSHEPMTLPACFGTPAWRERRSTAATGAPSTEDLSALLWHSARTQASLPSPAGLQLRHRPAPSAGAIHPIHVLLEAPGVPRWARYDPDRHRLDLLPEHWPMPRVRAAAHAHVGDTPGLLVLFVAEPGLTAAKYQAHESLVWRDAGALQAITSTVAASLGLEWSLLGLTGDATVAELGQQGQLIGVGTAVLGGRLC